MPCVPPGSSHGFPEVAAFCTSALAIVGDSLQSDIARFTANNTSRTLSFVTDHQPLCGQGLAHTDAFGNHRGPRLKRQSRHLADASIKLLLEPFPIKIERNLLRSCSIMRVVRELRQHTLLAWIDAPLRARRRRASCATPFACKGSTIERVVDLGVNVEEHWTQFICPPWLLLLPTSQLPHKPSSPAPTGGRSRLSPAKLP